MTSQNTWQWLVFKEKCHVKDHLQNGRLDLTKLKPVILDEVDQMLDMGFADQVEEILYVAYKKDSEDNPQTLVFSATCPHQVYNVAKKYMKSTYEQAVLIGKKTQKTAITVEVNDSFICWH